MFLPKNFINQIKKNKIILYTKYVCKFSVIIGLQASENLFQVNLTQDQAKVIAKSMPSGFSINLLRASKRDATKVIILNFNFFKQRIQQDISSEEDSKVKRRPPQPDPYKNQNDEIKKCNSLLAKLKKHQNASLFLRRLETVNYPADQEYIDFQIIENNLKNNEYQTINQFWADVRRIWQMSYAMNPKGSQVYAMTQEIDQYFTDIYKELDQPVLKQIISNPKQPAKAAQKKQPQSNPKPPIKNKMEEPMTTLEKKQLVNNIKKLPAEHLRGVWEIVSDGLTIQNQSEEIEFDIDTLPVKKTRQLEKYVNSKLQYIEKLQKQAKRQDYDSHTVNTDKILHRMNNVEYLPPKPIVSDIGQLQDSGDSSFSSDNEDDSR